MEKGGEERRLLRAAGGTFLVFETTHLTMKAEDLLERGGIPCRLFPKPRGVISECGLIVKVLAQDLEQAEKLCREQGVAVKAVLQLPGE